MEQPHQRKLKTILDERHRIRKDYVPHKLYTGVLIVSFNGIVTITYSFVLFPEEFEADQLQKNIYHELMGNNIICEYRNDTIITYGEIENVTNRENTITQALDNIAEAIFRHKELHNQLNSGETYDVSIYLDNILARKSLDVKKRLERYEKSIHLPCVAHSFEHLKKFQSVQREAAIQDVLWTVKSRVRSFAKYT
jgi:hypothetical protein